MRLLVVLSEIRSRGRCWREDDVLQRFVEWAQILSQVDSEIDRWVVSDYCDGDFLDWWPEWRSTLVWRRDRQFNNQ